MGSLAATVILSSDEFNPCSLVLFYIYDDDVYYVRGELPWTFGQWPLDEPLKEGDVECNDDMTMYEYIAKLDFPGAFCYSIAAPLPF